MGLIVFQLCGVLAFLMASMSLGLWVRRSPTARVARIASRFSHVAFHAGLLWPGLAGAFSPGLKRCDEVLGLRPLPMPSAMWLGVVLLVLGLCLAGASHIELWRLGRGAASFYLPKQVVHGGVYQRLRNPMTLGWYLICTALGLIAGSTYFVLYTVLLHIPAHIFYLKFFEEVELELRFGESYLDYKKRVPFLIPHWKLSS